MNAIEEKVYKSLYENAIVFLKDGIQRLVVNDNDKEDKISHELLILSCTSFQISLELALKALIIKNTGLDNILKKEQRGLSINDYESLISDNKLKTNNFETLKNYAKCSCS